MIIHYEERQAFYKTSFVWLAIPGMVVSIIITFSQTLKKPESSWDDLITLLLINAALIVFFILLRLETKLDEHGVYYRLFPFHLRMRFIAWTDVAQVKVRSYDPLGEYWGWGIKGTRKNRAINISGDVGLQLELKNGRKVLIGTLQKKMLEEVVEVVKNKHTI